MHRPQQQRSGENFFIDKKEIASALLAQIRLNSANLLTSELPYLLQYFMKSCPAKKGDFFEFFAGNLHVCTAIKYLVSYHAIRHLSYISDV